MLARTTRTVRVTDAGEHCLQDFRRILAEVLEADESDSGMHSSPRGRLTITAPVLFGGMYVTPIVTEYLSRYPEVSASFLFLDCVVNLLDEGADVSVCIGELPDSTMQAILVGQVRRVICASPGYLAKHGIPTSPDDLHAHTVVPASRVTHNPEWELMDKGEVLSIRLQARMITTTNDSAVAAAVGGFGVPRLLSYQVGEHLIAGRIKTVLPDFEPAALPVHVVQLGGHQAPRRVRAFLDLAIERLRQDATLNWPQIRPSPG